MKVPVVENVLKLNDELAAMNRRLFREHDVFVLDLIGAPGCGKTALLEASLQKLAGEMRIGVLVGDLTTTRDADRLARWCPQVVQINTGKGCHLDANQVRQALVSIDLAALDLLVIENVGNLICPVGFDLGQDVKVGMFSVPEGDDKPAKHPHLVHAAALVLLNKIDLLPYVPFDIEHFREDVGRLRDDVTLLEISAARGPIDPWLNWLRAQVGHVTGTAQSAQ